MPKKSAPSAADADFVEVLSYLRTQSLFPRAATPSCMNIAQNVHAMTHSLILWRFRLKRIPEHGLCFIEEIASDALQILPQLVSGFVKPVKLLTRGIIENLLRHVYFLDHPIEFEKMNRHPKWYISIEDLFEYAKDHPLLSEAERSFDALGRMKMLYNELSAGVHGRRVQDLQMNIALSKIAYSDDLAQRDAQVLSKVTESANFVLAAFHRNQFGSFERADRKLILQTLSANAKRVLVQLQ